MKQIIRQVLRSIVLSAFLLTALQSCSLLRESDPMMKIHQGQTQQEILTLLGKPKFRRFNQQQEEWEYRRYNNYAEKVTVITFVDHRVAKLDSYQIDVPARPVPRVVEREVHHEPSVGDIVFGEIFSRRDRGRHCEAGHRGRGRYRVSGEEFRRIRKDVDSGFNSDKLPKLRFYAKNMDFSCNQIVKLLSCFSFEDDRLSALRVLAPCIYDRANIGVVIRSFSFKREEAADILDYPH